MLVFRAGSVLAQRAHEQFTGLPGYRCWYLHLKLRGIRHRRLIDRRCGVKSMLHASTLHGEEMDNQSGAECEKKVLVMDECGLSADPQTAHYYDSCMSSWSSISGQYLQWR